MLGYRYLLSGSLSKRVTDILVYFYHIYQNFQTHWITITRLVSRRKSPVFVKMSPLLVTVFIASLAFSLQDDPYKFEPESHHIVVNEGEDYEVAFNQFDNQTAFGHCYYASSLYNGDYPIFAGHNSKKSLQSDTSKGLSPFEAMCGFILYTVDEKSPLKWTITAFDNYTETNFTEEVTVEFYCK